MWYHDMEHKLWPKRCLFPAFFPLDYLFEQKLQEKVHCVKSVRIRSYFGLHFPAFGLNTERYGVPLRIQSKCGKMRTRITPNTDNFHAVIFSMWLKNIHLYSLWNLEKIAKFHLLSLSLSKVVEDHSFSTDTKFSEKLTFVTSWFSY